MKISTLLNLVAISVLSACANTGQLTGDLKPSTATDRYDIKMPLTYVELRGVVNMRWEEGVAPCVFKPAKSNGEGTFYEGDGKCVTQKMANDTMGSPFRGGIWIPTDSKKAPRLYYYFDYNVDTAIKGGGVLTAAILEAGKGDLTFMPDIKDSAFLSALSAAHQPGT